MTPSYNKALFLFLWWWVLPRVRVRGQPLRSSSPRLYCRGDNGGFPTQQIIWQTGFPSSAEPLGLCEGSVQVGEEICVSGRINYEQLQQALGPERIVLSPNLRTSSIQGHLVSGVPNVIRGTERRFLYDYVTRYTVGGVEHTATRETVTDHLLAASRGLIDSVCFDSSLAQEPEDYSISHDIWRYTNVDIGAMGRANTLFINRFSVVAEYLRPFHTDEPYSSFFGNLAQTLFTASIDASPGFVFNVVPFLGVTPWIRYWVNGNTNTARFPVPLVANEVVVDNVEVDTEWDTLLQAMAAEEEGLFASRDSAVPLYYGAIIKKVMPTANPKGCWTVPMAAISLNAPPGQGKALDEYVNEKVIPRLQRVPNATIGTHFGNRLNPQLLEVALEKYQNDCGVEINLSLNDSECYHPACRRSTQITDFAYPEEYFEFPAR